MATIKLITAFIALILAFLITGWLGTEVIRMNEQRKKQEAYRDSLMQRNRKLMKEISDIMSEMNDDIDSTLWVWGQKPESDLNK